VAKEGIYFGQRFGNTVTNIDTAPKNIEDETTNEGYINEMLFYGKVWGLARTAVNKCMLHRDHEFVTVKGRPKAASHKNAAKITSQDIGNKKKCGQYTCGFCKEPSHNIATCPNKVE
ncbi:19647_t:CDS:2, partial [Racocetra persica]